MKLSLEGIPYLSIIEDRSDRVLIVDNPLDKGELVPIDIGAQVFCSLQHENAIYQFSAQVLDRRKEKNLHLLVIEKPQNLNRVQRRQFFRLSLSLPIQYRVLPDLRAVSTAPFKPSTTVDVSGGGVLFTAEDDLQRDSVVEMLIDIPVRKNETYSIPCIGRIVVVKGEKKEKDFGVEFVVIEEKDREKLIKIIFEEQAKQRRKEMRWVDHLAD